MKKYINIGVVGAGHLGKIHLKLLNQSNLFKVLGFYDINSTVRKEVSRELGLKSYKSLKNLIDDVDAIDIVTPTENHFEIAKQSINKLKHVFIEKPVTKSIEEANELLRLSKINNVKVQIGHIERFNPAYKVAKKYLNDIKFIETHRLAQFNPRGTDVPVVLDLMIHDIDTTLALIKSPVKNISANGVSIISKTADIANARIEFENGCISNLTSSRISMKSMRKARFFQKDSYVSIDYLNKKVEVVKIKDAPKKNGPFDLILKNDSGVKKIITFDKPKVNEFNAILFELESFADSIIHNKPVVVTLSDGKRALNLALKISEKIKSTLK